MSATPSGQPVLIMAGGTGGHVFPGLAVARELLQRNIPVAWLGTRTGLEARLVPVAGLPTEWLQVSGLRGKDLRSLLQAPLMLARALAQALTIVRRLRPRLAIGMGGFVSGPGGIAARLLGVPLLVHEQNAVAGLTNRILARFSERVLEAFGGSFAPGCRALEVGNPVRSEIVALPPPGERMQGREGRLRLLVLGGSQGARALNRLVPEALARMDTDTRPQVRHQCGRDALEDTRERYAMQRVQAEVVEFIAAMAEAYGWADLVLCRSGALTVSELASAGVGALLVPYPHAVDDHQTANGRFLVGAGAAELLPECDLSAESLAASLIRLGADRQRLLAMAAAARGRARPAAATLIADEVLRHAR
jgi:UDP-N-acetylglucosamine--N-acetylmuramyl-(pentapeptide) pyrophosphoryl-undecaprenol N-acetylglucosamine transferase